MEQSRTLDRSTRGLTIGVAVLSQLAASVVGITAILYVIGYIEAKIYFDHYHISWVTSLLTPQQVMTGPGLFIYIFMPINILLVWLFQANRYVGGDSFLGSGRFSAAIPWIGVSAPVLGGVLWTIFKSHDRASALTMVVLGIGILGTWVVWFALDRLASPDSRRRGFALTVMVPSGLLLWTVAFPVAGAYLQVKVDAEAVSYSRVVLKGEEGNWRLVGAVGDRFMLESMKNGNEHVYRLVNPSDAAAIVPWSKD